MINKVLQGALSASMLLSGIVVYSPVIVNAQEQSPQTMQTQNVSNLVSKTTNNSLRVEKKVEITLLTYRH